MKTSIAIPELERMSPSELQRELKIKRAEAARMRLGLEMQKEKDHAAYRVLRKDIARMSMIAERMKKSKKNEKSEKNTNKTTSKLPTNPVKDASPENSTIKSKLKKSDRSS